MTHKLEEPPVAEKPKFTKLVKLALENLKDEDSKKDENKEVDEQEDKKKEFTGSSTEQKLRAADVSAEINKHDPGKTPLVGDAKSVNLPIDKRTSNAKFPGVVAGTVFKFQRAFSAVHIQTAGNTTNHTIDTNKTDTNETIPRKPYQIALETIRLHVAQAVALERKIMKLIQTNSKLTVEGIISLRKTQDIDSKLLGQLTNIINTTLTNGPKNRKLYNLLKKKVQEAVAEINSLNERLSHSTNLTVNEDGSENTENANGTTTISAKQLFSRRKNILGALEENHEAAAAFQELISARLKLANSLTAVHRLSTRTMRKMKNETLAQLEPRFDKIMSMGEHIKEAKKSANAATMTAIEERSQAEQAALGAGVEPLSDIKSDLGV